jgi:hypothetical protein
VKDFPFKQQQIGKNVFLREFNKDVNNEELVWHRDREDRIIEVFDNEDWYFQMDNELPKKLMGKFFVPKETYHRLIKGNGNLIVKVTKLQ